MTTKNIVPRNNNEGNLGTDAKRWAGGNFQTLSVGGLPVNVSVVFVDDQSARFALTSADVKIGDIVQQGTSSPYTFFTVIDTSNLGSNVGYYSASGGGNIFDQSLNTTDEPVFTGVDFLNISVGTTPHIGGNNGQIDFFGGVATIFNDGAARFNSITLPNSTILEQGTFDNGTGGANGISLFCTVGYELNFQGGRLANYADGQYQILPIDSPVYIWAHYNNNTPAFAAINSDDLTMVQFNSDSTGFLTGGQYISWDASGNLTAAAFYGIGDHLTANGNALNTLGSIVWDTNVGSSSGAVTATSYGFSNGVNCSTDIYNAFNVNNASGIRLQPGATQCAVIFTASNQNWEMGTDIGNTGAVEFGIFDFQVNAKVFWMDNSQNGHFYGDLYLAGSSIGSQDWSGRGGTIDNAGYAVYASGANVANYLNGGIGPNFYFNTNDDTWTTAGYITAGGYYGNHYGNLYGNANSANYATNAQNDQNGNLIGAANWTGLGGIIDYAALSIALWDNASSPSHGFSWNANSNYSWSTWNGANFDNLTAGTVILYGDVNVPQGLIYPQQQPTSTAPTWVEGGMYYDTTLHKLRIGGVSGWETVTSV